MPFVHLHGHSTFSFLEAIGKPQDIIKKAQALGMEAIALTDYYWTYGAIKLYLSAKEAWIKPIIWAELGFTLDIKNTSNPNWLGNIVLLAQTTQGYQALITLVSHAHLHGMIWGKPTIDLSMLQEHAKDIISIAWSPDSRIGKMILADEPLTKIQEITKNLQHILGEDYVYYEIMMQDYNDMPELQKIHEKLLSSTIPCVMTTNYFYLNEEDKSAREVTLAIKDGKKIFDETRRKPKGKFHIMSEEEIRTIAKNNGLPDTTIEQLLQNTYNIAKNTNIDIQINQVLFPNYEPSEDIIAMYEQYKNHLLEQ